MLSSLLVVFVGLAAITGGGFLVWNGVEGVKGKRSLPALPAKKDMPVEIFIGENARVKLEKVSFSNPQDLERQFLAAVGAEKPGSPYIWNRKGDPSNPDNPDGIPVTNIIIKNNGLTSVKNAQITITSNLPITPRTLGISIFSVNQVNAHTELRPYGTLGYESYYSLEAHSDKQSAPLCFLVTIGTDDYAPYAAIGCINMRFK